MCLKADDSRDELAEFSGWVLSVGNGTVKRFRVYLVDYT
jgi:hypothetical protein